MKHPVTPKKSSAPESLPSPSTTHKHPIQDEHKKTPSMSNRKANSKISIPTPSFTPSSEHKVPNSKGKRSYDVLAEESRSSKKAKTVRQASNSSNNDESGHSDIDSDASTEIASDVEGYFKQSLKDSEIEHESFARQSAEESCLTPERPKKTQNIGSSTMFSHMASERTNSLTQRLKQIESVTTPKGQISEARLVSRSSSDIEAPEFDPSKEMLLIDKNGKKKVRSLNRFAVPKALSYDVSQESEDDSEKEARLIEEANQADDDGLVDQSRHNNSDDEGFSDNEDLDEAFDNEEKLTNYFSRMRRKRRLRNEKRGKKGSLNASPIREPSYSEEKDEEESSSKEEEEEQELYLNSLLEKHKSLPGEESSKETRLRNKRLMRFEENDNDMYLNFGLTLGELSRLKKTKKIFVFEDPKEESSSNSS